MTSGVLLPEKNKQKNTNQLSVWHPISIQNSFTRKRGEMRSVKRTADVQQILALYIEKTEKTNIQFKQNPMAVMKQCP